MGSDHGLSPPVLSCRGFVAHSGAGRTLDRRHCHCGAVTTPDNFTIFEGTSEIQRLIIGRAVTGLDVR